MAWTKRLCRICAQIGDACYPIFDVASGRDIERKMKKCFSFIAFEDDYKPKEICNCCYMKLNQLFDFVELCYTSNTKFETDMIFSPNQALWSEKQTQDYGSCQLSGVIVNSRTNLETSNLTPEVMMVLNYESPAQLNQPVDVSLNNVNRNCSKSDMRLVKIESEKACANLEPYVCYKQSQTVLRHSSDFYTSPEVNFVTIAADKIVNYSDVNNEYGKLIKEKEIISETNVKDEGVSSNNTKTKHIENVPKKVCQKSVDTKKTLPCEHCAKTFTRKSALNMHLAVHSTIRLHKCEICNKSFPSEKHLKTHKSTHKNTYQCKYCAKGFSVPSKLERHLRIHTNTKPFTCEQCGKSFSDKCNLEGHKLSHSDQKNFTCNICNKSYKKNSHLKDHMKAHSNNKPYKCSLCGKSYKWKTNLRIHMRGPMHIS